MSFKPSQTQQNAQQQQLALSKQAIDQSGKAMETGQGLLNLGGKTVTPATNFFSILGGGNTAAIQSALRPNIDRARQAQQSTLQNISTMLPRGGGRSGALFDASYAPSRDIGQSFDSARMSAFPALAQIGQQQQSMAPGFFGLANQGLGVGGQMQSDVVGQEQRQQQMKNQFWSQLGSGLFGIATLPFGGSSRSLLQRI